MKEHNYKITVTSSTLGLNIVDITEYEFDDQTSQYGFSLTKHQVIVHLFKYSKDGYVLKLHRMTK